jgi:hypothetical protein
MGSIKFELLKKMSKISKYIPMYVDRLCGLVVSVPGYKSRGPGSIPLTTRFSEK